MNQKNYYWWSKYRFILKEKLVSKWIDYVHCSCSFHCIQYDYLWLSYSRYNVIVVLMSWYQNGTHTHTRYKVLNFFLSSFFRLYCSEEAKCRLQWMTDIYMTKNRQTHIVTICDTRFFSFSESFVLSLLISRFK